MTTQSEAREAIYEAFVTAWGSTSPYLLDNEKFDPPAIAEWVRCTVRHRGSDQETLGDTGTRKFLRTGAVFIQIFTPLDTGTKLADTLARTARAIYEGKSLLSSQIRFRGVSIRELGPGDDSYMVVVEAPFEYNETK